MSTPSSPDILEWGQSLVHLWTERGDLTDASQEEGRKEGDEEEEVRGCPGKGGSSVSRPPSFFAVLGSTRVSVSLTEVQED